MVTTTKNSELCIDVVHRNGSITGLDVGKIRHVIHWACERLEVNSIELEAGLTTRLKDGVTTREIQENLINFALKQCSIDEPDWQYVAGRLVIWSIIKDVIAVRGYGYGNYVNHILSELDEGTIDKRLNVYSRGELALAESWINTNLDKDYDYAGATLLKKRYLRNELPQEAFLTISLLLASGERAEDRLVWAKRFYEAVSQKKISLATPFLANLRVPGKSLSSCFITAMDDNLESIFKVIANVAQISKQGGGVGIDMSRIRAAGSSVAGRPNSSGGVLPWIKILNDTAVAVNQGGLRAGSVTTAIDIWHLDVPEFLEMQTEHGDQRTKAYDIFPQLVISDEFMRRVKAGEEWTLVDPYEVRTKLGFELAELWGQEFEKSYQRVESLTGKTLTLYKVVNAKELFKRIMRSQLETGMPYLAFKDTINRANPNKHLGYIPCVNLCIESFSVVSPGSLTHCCNLSSLNLANIDTETELAELCETTVRLLDNGIELTIPPTKEAKRHDNLLRTIGVGAMGLADWIAKNQLSYECVSKINDLLENIAYHCTKASMKLSKERGAYEGFKGSEWSKGKLLGGKSLKEIQQHSHNFQRWEVLATDIKTYGIRNSHITSIAPNTSSALVQGCTASVLPTFSRFQYEKHGKGSAPKLPPFVKDKYWFYQENKYVDQRVVVNATAAIQRWIDTGISMELLFNLNPNIYREGQIDAKDIFDVLIHAWESGCKAIYYIRTIQSDSFNYDNSSDCAACAN